MPFARLISVLHPDVDREVQRVTEEQASRLLRLGQAHKMRGGRTLRLYAWSEMPMTGGRTRTSRGGMLAAIGRSQKYTTQNQRGDVNGFKYLAPEDRVFFQEATLGETL